jgi:hypothetical protein
MPPRLALLMKRGHSASEARTWVDPRFMFGAASCDSLAKSTRPTYEAQIRQFDADSTPLDGAACAAIGP